MEDDKLFESFNIAGIITKQLNGKALSHVEQEKLSVWLNAAKANKELYAGMYNPEQVADSLAQLSKDKTNAAYRHLINRIGHTKKKPFLLRYKYLVTAAAILIVAFGTGLYLYRTNLKQNAPVVATIPDVAPGTNKATLTLANGKKISLTDAKVGNIVNQPGITITKLTDGRLQYTVTDAPYKANDFNIVETPKGGQYRVRLPDGTEVWLNAASSLKYPASFSGQSERRVELNGEAYFQVAHNKAQPFIVTTASQQVAVLGTHFNINSYADEKKVITTLEEGSVKVSSGSQTKTIRPGEQTLSANGNMVVQKADLETALAWKNGLFVFKDASIPTVMRQISRWYNVDIEYNGTIPADVLNGGISRQSNLSTVLKMFDALQIRYQLQQNGSLKKLVINP